MPVQQLVDQNAHTLVTTDPTAWFSALEVGPQGFSRPVIVLIGNSSIRATSPSDTDMAFPPRSRRTGAVVDGFILPESRPVARQGKNDKHRSMPRQIRSKMSSNSGVSAVLTCIWNTALPQMERSELRLAEILC